MTNTIEIKSSGQTEMIDITGQIVELLEKSKTKDGFCFIYVPHTTAAVTINENADPSVESDILKAINNIIPFQYDYSHLEGNSAAHIKTTLVGSPDIVAVEGGRLQLGTWQAVFFCEFDGPRTRKVQVRFFD